MVFELWTKQFPEAESIFPAVFGNLIDGSQNAVWRLALELEIPQIYENRSNEYGRQSLLPQFWRSQNALKKEKNSSKLFAIPPEEKGCESKRERRNQVKGFSNRKWQNGYI